jgi:NAD+ diphosphatase
MAFLPRITNAPEYERQTFFVVHPKGLVARVDGERVVLPTVDDFAALGVSASTAQRFGILDETDVFVLPFAGEAAAPFEVVGLRALASLLGSELFRVVGHAMHTADWLTTSRFCGRCGTPTVRVENERCMACPACGLHTYPRISPAIITLVRKGELALLASNAKFPGAFYSTLAGFSEIGESLEETLKREVREEAGVEVTNVRYFGSQPWPFPNSLMIGFTADWAGGEIRIDPNELSDAKWFSADALPQVPPSISIARQLIDAWVAEAPSKPRIS